MREEGGLMGGGGGWVLQGLKAGDFCGLRLGDKLSQLTALSHHYYHHHSVHLHGNLHPHLHPQPTPPTTLFPLPCPCSESAPSRTSSRDRPPRHWLVNVLLNDLQVGPAQAPSLLPLPPSAPPLCCALRFEDECYFVIISSKHIDTVNPELRRVGFFHCAQRWK